MVELLTTIILSVCPIQPGGGTTPCMEDMYNCSVTLKDGITKESINACLEKYGHKPVKL